MTPRKPIHTRDKDGRHRIDLRQLPPFPRYAIAVAVVIFVFGLVVRVGGGDRVSSEDVAPFIPWVGGGVILIVAVAVVLILKDRR
ncbi:hypothetical protein LY632_05495 [Erythrobacter sp. SDW2]|uniref:hypothetical protein n=1 Tax=Erythrobacter sp. SDW2 TaxID=2907154 RepID=UPI001F36ED6D|nr:hypothetical protein [Erythrobacter sp. SDW2]UIP07855.1 hypothetical protein LY632_05495 [Erythrobacter sp. SDW2]